jgi:hypothetical protein
MLMKHLFRLFILLFILLTTSALRGQESINQSDYSNAGRIADSLLQAGDFKQAIAHYKNLLSTYPGDAMLHYSIGVAYLKGTRDYTTALSYLKAASAKEVPNLVYFYLAEAYYCSYSFDEAIANYRRFSINGGSPQISNQMIEQRLIWCENGNFMLKYLYQPIVLDKIPIASNDYHKFVSQVKPEWVFVSIPNDLKTSVDKKLLHESVIFYPKNPKVGDRVYFSSYGSTTSQGKDIFMIERLPDGFWSKPKNLGDPINTPLDEDFPFMDQDGSLYFASKGHYSMGGFDVYRSVYNYSTNQWTTPENMGFPFSSPFDDFLYTPSLDKKSATFFTNRHFMSDSLEVVMVEIEMNPIRRAESSIDIIREVANLKLNGSKKVPPVNERPVIDNISKSTSFIAVENDPEYVRALAIGFAEQTKTDSLRVRLEALRSRFDFISTADERRKLESQVVKVEDAMLQAQQNADVQFALASKIEQEYLTNKRVPIEKKSENFVVDNPKFIYQAQFASTVFHSEELKQLANVEKNASSIGLHKTELLNIRSNLKNLELSDNYAEDTNYIKLYSTYVSRLKLFNPQYQNYTSTKKKLYSDCISVAMVKQGASEKNEIREEIRTANTFFRTATSLRNNLSPESSVESTFEALLLDDLGILRLEVAFARLWSINLFEQQTLSSILKLEQAIFGKQFESQRNDKIPTAAVKEPQQEKPQLIIQSSAQAVVDPIQFKPDLNLEFQVVDLSPYSVNAPIPVDEPIVQGVIYKIQLGAFSVPKNIDWFKGITPLSAESINGGRITKYYAGKFAKLANAEKSLSTIKGMGFKDAFIVAWHNGRTVALSRAQSLEGQIPASQSNEKISIQLAETGKSYMIQLGNYKGRLPDDVLQTVRALAPGKDVVRKPDNTGGFIYSLGSFSTANEAGRVKDNLIASGIGAAKVIIVENE